MKISMEFFISTDLLNAYPHDFFALAFDAVAAAILSCIA